MSKFKKGLRYQCNHSLSFWRKGYYYYCPQDNLLKCSGDFVKVLLDIPAEEYDNYFLYCWT